MLTYSHTGLEDGVVNNVYSQSGLVLGCISDIDYCSLCVSVYYEQIHTVNKSYTTEINSRLMESEWLRMMNETTLFTALYCAILCKHTVQNLGKRR